MQFYTCQLLLLVLLLKLLLSPLLLLLLLLFNIWKLRNVYINIINAILHLSIIIHIVIV